MTDLSIAAVLRHYGADVDVPDTGWRPIKCPFHSDRTASASVNIEIGGFRCHGCGISGDGIKIIEDQEHIDFEAALEFAREVLDQSMEEVSQKSRKARGPRRATIRKGLFD
jgi:DNA primase